MKILQARLAQEDRAQGAGAELDPVGGVRQAVEPGGPDTYDFERI